MVTKAISNAFDRIHHGEVVSRIVRASIAYRYEPTGFQFKPVIATQNSSMRSMRSNSAA